MKGWLFKLTVLLFFGLSGCSITTTGDASWEIYCGVRTTQKGDAPANVQAQSSVVEKILDFATADLFHEDQ